MHEGKFVPIPSRLLDPLFCFMRYTLICALHLNKLGVQGQANGSVVPNNQPSINKRKRIIDKLANGYSVSKKRRFLFSRMDEALGGVSMKELEEQIRILEAHVVVTCPTRRSVELARRMSGRAQAYLLSSCGYNPDDVTRIQELSMLLTD